jgi:predicted PurR-regulated permease PerM
MLTLVDPKQLFRTTLESSIEKIFISNLKKIVFHFLFTWLTFNIFNASFVYCTAFIAGVFSVVPVLEAYWACFGGALELILIKGQWISGCLLFVLHFIVSQVVNDAIYSEIPSSSSSVVGYTVVLGYLSLGSQGLILGPLLACIPVIFYNLINDE